MNSLYKKLITSWEPFLEASAPPDVHFVPLISLTFGFDGFSFSSTKLLKNVHRKPINSQNLLGFAVHFLALRWSQKPYNLEAHEV